jgi:hypothetical protein
MLKVMCRWLVLWKQSRCVHAWRPAKYRDGLVTDQMYRCQSHYSPARHCGLCDLTEYITMELYYAQFGRIFVAAPERVERPQEDGK